MKSLTRWCGILGLLGLLSGCVPSLYPLYTDTDIIIDDKVVGDWGECRIAKAESNTYHVVMVDKSGEGHFIGRLVKLEGKMFLDITPDRKQIENSVNAIYQMALLPLHLFFYVRQATPTLEMASMEPKRFKERLKLNPKALAVMDSNGGVIISPTRDLQAFVVNNMECFSDFSKMTKRE